MNAAIRTLYVDGDRDVAETTVSHIERNHDHIEVVIETSVAAVLDRLANASIDCIISTYNLPDTNGLELLETVREEHPELPFILVTETESEALAGEAIAADVTDYIPTAHVPEPHIVLADRIEAAVEQYRTRRDAERERTHRSALFTNTPDPIVKVSFDGTTPLIDRVNPAFEDVFGFEREEVLGRSVTDVLVPEGERDEHLSLRDTVAEGAPVETEVRRQTADGIRAFRLRIIPITETEISESAYAWYTDITERKQYEHRLETLNEAAHKLLAADTKDKVADIAVEIAESVLDETLTAVWRYDRDGNRLVPLAAADAAANLDNTQETADTIGAIPVGTTEMEIFRAGESTVIEDYRDVDAPAHPENPLRTLLLVPLGEYGQLHVGSPTVEEINATTRKLIEVLARNVTAALERVEHEQTLGDLHDVTRDFMRASSPEEIASLGVAAGRDILGLPLTHFYDLTDDGQRLAPLAATEEMRDRFGDLPVFDRGEGMLWDAFEADTILQYDDAQTTDEMASDLPFRGAIIATVGNHGVFGSASLEPKEFDAFDQEVASILTAEMEAALDAAERRQALRDREQELERQNERLDTFASVVSHDLRNPLNVATGRLSLAQEECESEHLDDVRSALDRMDTMIDDLLTLARAGQTVDDTGTVDLTSMVENCWRNVDTADAELISETERMLQADESQLQHVFENLFRNAVEHGSDSVTIRVGNLEDRDGFFVEDDGPGIPEEEREHVCDFGYSTTEDGTGFGLSIVKEIVEAHGWEINVTDGIDGGARFEVKGVEPGY